MYGALAALAIYAILIYNKLINLKHNITKSWANINVLLKQRHDELPKLLAFSQEETRDIDIHSLFGSTT